MTRSRVLILSISLLMGATTLLPLTLDGSSPISCGVSRVQAQDDNSCLEQEATISALMLENVGLQETVAWVASENEDLRATVVALRSHVEKSASEDKVTSENEDLKATVVALPSNADKAASEDKVAPEIVVSQSDVAAGQIWLGIFYEPPDYEMILSIEAVTNRNFSGFLRWPTLRNSITSMHGEVVQDFGDFVEQSKWEFIDGFDTATGGIWLKFTETSIVQGSGITLNGWYYAHIDDADVMRGVWFRPGASEPRGRFEIFLQP
jgi:hypothetical protein